MKGKDRAFYNLMYVVSPLLRLQAQNLSWHVPANAGFLCDKVRMLGDTIKRDNRAMLTQKWWN